MSPPTGPALAGPSAVAPVGRRPRSYTVALGSLAVGAALLFLASGRVWATVVVGDPGLPSITVEITGRELTFGGPLALLSLAGIAGLVALRRVGRVVAGLVLVLASGLALVSVLVFGFTNHSSLGAGDWISGIAGDRAGVDGVFLDAAISVWWVVEVAGVVLVGLAGALAVVASRTWPRLGRRYERDGTPVRRAAAAATPSVAGSAWDQLDAGLDPTVDPAVDATADPPGDPARDSGAGP